MFRSSNANCVWSRFTHNTVVSRFVRKLGNTFKADVLGQTGLTIVVNGRDPKRSKTNCLFQLLQLSNHATCSCSSSPTPTCRNTFGTRSVELRRTPLPLHQSESSLTKLGGVRRSVRQPTCETINTLYNNSSNSNIILFRVCRESLRTRFQGICTKASHVN